MSWFYLYRESDGALLSESSSAPESVPDGVQVAESADRKSQTHDWDPSLPGWVTRPAAVRITLDELWDRLTEVEQILYYSLPPTDEDAVAIDSAIARNRALAGGWISLNSPVVAAMFDRLVNAGVITAERKEEILS